MRVLVVGAAHLQIVARPHGESGAREHEGEITFGIGGTGWNLAHGLKRIGRSVTLLTAWNDAPVSKLIRAHIAESGVDVIADEVPDMPLAASVAQTSPSGHLAHAVTAAPIGDYEFSEERIEHVLTNITGVVLDANLSPSTVRMIASAAVQRGIPVFLVGVSEDKVDRVMSAAGLLSCAFVTYGECEQLLDLQRLADPVDLASAIGAPVAVIREQGGIVFYTPDGSRIRNVPATLREVRNFLGVRDAYAVEAIDALLASKLAFDSFAGPIHGLVAEVAACDASNSSRENALDSMIGGLQKDASHDQLTGLFRRRAFEEHYTRLRSGRDTMMLIDCDHFKRVNDNEGHDAGDQVLRTVAGLIQSSLRATDVACRWGGDEFVVLLTRASEEESSVVAERIRAKAEAAELHGVTLSIGLTAVWREENLADAINRADDAMYMAKHGGKNALVWAYAAA